MSKNVKISTESLTFTTTPNGLQISVVVDFQYMKKLYMGYSKKEATKLFKNYCREELNKIFVNEA